MHITLRSYTFLSGILFALMGLAHAVRLYFGWEVLLDGKPIGEGISWLFLAISVGIAWEAVKLSKAK